MITFQVNPEKTLDVIGKGGPSIRLPGRDGLPHISQVANEE